MIVHPRTWGFICTTAHPQGCERNVIDQINATTALGVRSGGPRNVLVIGASTGYGLAARIVAAFGFGAATLGVFREKPGRARKAGSAGWYNAAAFDRCAKAAGRQSLSINGDAFSDAVRERAIAVIKGQMSGPIDLVVYSLAAPARHIPATGHDARTTLKPIGEAFSGLSIDTDSDQVVTMELAPATDAEVIDTVAVMGGDDWQLWIEALTDAKVLAPHARTVAFSYIGPKLTWPIYRHGTIGRAKEALAARAHALCEDRNDPAFARIAVLKSIVTQASAAIPAMPLYISLVYKIMKDKGVHETAIDQQNRLFRNTLYPDPHHNVAAADAWRLDDLELREDIQRACRELWPQVTTENLTALTDYAGYKEAFLNLFGFARPDVDYDAEIDTQVDFDCMTV